MIERDEPWWATSTGSTPAKIRGKWPQRFAIGALSVVALVVLGLVVNANPGRQGHTFPNGSVVAPPTVQALSAGCMGVITHQPPPPATVGWVPPQVQPVWEFTPSTGGNFAKEAYIGPAFVGENSDFDQAQAVSMLYRGWIVVWYQAVTPPNEIEQARASVENLLPGSRVIVARWKPTSRSAWPTQHNWWITGWNTGQPCSTYSTEVVQQFRAAVPIASAPGAMVSLTNPGPRAENVVTAN